MPQPPPPPRAITATWMPASGESKYLIRAGTMAQMKRAGRWLFNFATAGSLGISVLTSLSWAVSYWRQDLLDYTTAVGPMGMKGYSMASIQGRLILRTWQCSFPASSREHFILRDNGGNAAGGWSYESVQVQTPSSDLSSSWLRYFSGEDPPPEIPTDPHYQTQELILAHWLVLLLVAAPAVSVGLRSLARRRMLRPGHCLTCGYDLRATPDRCPECGTAVNDKSQSAVGQRTRADSTASNRFIAGDLHKGSGESPEDCP
jgi:hypothetical protein